MVQRTSAGMPSTRTRCTNAPPGKNCAGASPAKPWWISTQSPQVAGLARTAQTFSASERMSVVTVTSAMARTLSVRGMSAPRGVLPRAGALLLRVRVRLVGSDVGLDRIALAQRLLRAGGGVPTVCFSASALISAPSRTAMMLSHSHMSRTTTPARLP